MIKMNSIEKFSDVLYDIKYHTFFEGFADDGAVILDETKKLPKVNFTCTVKLHGTFAGVIWDKDKLQPTSKSQTISIISDNAGFANFISKSEVESHFKEQFKKINLPEAEVSIMGEWCGKGIQKGVGVNKLEEKTFFMFGIKASWEKEDEEDSKRSYWLENAQELLENFINPELNIRSIYEFLTYQVEVDFNNPSEALVKLDNIRDSIDNNCPVAQAFGIEGIGEGLVAQAWWDGKRYIFKHKGEMHKVKTNKIPKVEDPQEQAKIDCAELITPVWRLEQAVNEVCDENPNIKNLGEVIKWVIADIIKEEIKVIQEAGFELKELQSYISKIVRDWFLKEIE